MRFVDGKKSDRHSAEPIKRISRGESLWRKIEQPVFTASRLLHDAAALFRRLVAIDNSGGDAHLRQLGRLVLHQRDQRRYHHRRFPGD